MRIGRRGLQAAGGTRHGDRCCSVYVGIALVAITALPVHDGHTELAGRYLNDPVIGIVTQMHPHWLAQTLRYVVGALATLTLVAAANSAMLGLSRLAYSLSTNRQIPSGLGRLHPQRSTPYVLIVLAGLLAAALVVPEDLDFLVGIYAFGAMLAFTIAHLSIWRLRYSEPDRDRPYRVPLSVRVRGGELPLPAVLGALICGAGWVAVMVAARTGALRRAGLDGVRDRRVRRLPPRGRDLADRAGDGLAADAARRAAGRARLRLDPRAAVRHQARRGHRADGGPAGRGRADRGGGQRDRDETATIEAVWIFVMPMSLPLDARLPEEQVKHARQALARAKAVGEEYGGVYVATATVRTRRAGYAIVEEARRRGVEAIVLGAEEPSQDPRRRGPGRPRRAAGELRGGGHQVRDQPRPPAG